MIIVVRCLFQLQLQLLLKNHQKPLCLWVDVKLPVSFCCRSSTQQRMAPPSKSRFTQSLAGKESQLFNKIQSGGHLVSSWQSKAQWLIVPDHKAGYFLGGVALGGPLRFPWCLKFLEMWWVIFQIFAGEAQNVNLKIILTPQFSWNPPEICCPFMSSQRNASTSDSKYFPVPHVMTSFIQWLFLVPIKGGRWHIILNWQYIPLI